MRPKVSRSWCWTCLPRGFLATVIAKQLVSAGLDYPSSVVTGILPLATCVKDLAGVRDNPLAIGAAAVSCLQAADETVARRLSLALLSWERVRSGPVSWRDRRSPRPRSIWR